MKLCDFPPGGVLKPSLRHRSRTTPNSGGAYQAANIAGLAQKYCLFVSRRITFCIF